MRVRAFLNINFKLLMKVEFVSNDSHLKERLTKMREVFLYFEHKQCGYIIFLFRSFNTEEHLSWKLNLDCT